ncbi:Membrane-bound lytic murein transglycosylase D precursor [Minicystis rosea]|nr:Membrane-bound lytic murein transglycosylase D precursor [Minicystis rosea]
MATLILPAPRGRAASDAHDAAAALTPSGTGGPTAAAHVPQAPPPTPAAKPPAHPTAPSAVPHAAPAAEEHHEPTPAGQVVSITALRKIMTRLPLAKGQRYLEPLNQAMAEFHITTRLRKAAFLAQIAHESGELQWFQEFASGMEYDIRQRPKKALELGNVNPGDGPRYKGRGPIQLTGRNNYRACGKALGLDLEGHPELAIGPGVAFRSAGWFWSTHNLNTLADKSDFRAITRRINGGYNHYAERLAYYQRALTVFPADAHT